MSNTVLCSISTRGRYDTTLSLAIQSVITQTVRPDKLVIFDDNDTPKDIREIETYFYLLKMLEEKGISWEIIFGEKKGQHFNHQKANKMGYKFVWRLDDDTVAEPDVLEKLLLKMDDDVGAVGGSILTPPGNFLPNGASNNIRDIHDQPNVQWARLDDTFEVDHLHCSFLYRAGIFDYNTKLSRVAHREETLFTYGLKQKGYKILVTPCITWHLRNRVGGIRDGDRQLFETDEYIFNKTIELWHSKRPVVVLNNGMGDHIVFRRVLQDFKVKPVIYSCYPDIVPGASIAEAEHILVDLDPWNIYVKMDEWNWKDSLESAFRKMYAEHLK